MMVRRVGKFAKFVFAPLLLVTAGALLLGGCRGRHCGWHASPEERADKIVKHLSGELDLNEKQRAGLEKIKADFLARQGDFQAIHGGLREEILAQLRSGSVDQAKLNQSLTAREGKMQEMRAFLVQEFAEFHGLLDSAQREKLAKKIESRCR